MSKKEKRAYAKLLALRLAFMLSENDEEYDKFNKICYKKSYGHQLTNNELNIYYRAGRKYSISAVNRVRIELSKILLELDKEFSLWVKF